MLMIIVQYMEGSRKKEAERYVSLVENFNHGPDERDSYTIVFHENQRYFALGLCLITLFLALAFTDKTFTDYITPECLNAMKKYQVGGLRSLE